MATQYMWREFLKRVSKQLIETADEYDHDLFFNDKDYHNVVNDMWFGYEAATNFQIEEVEIRLGTRLPPDYREFLLVTNGWRNFKNFPYFLVDLLPIEEVDWFAQKDKRIGRLESWIDLQRNHRLRKEEQLPEEHLRATLMIGESDGNECLLLNPLVKTPSNEWEAWSYEPENGFDRVSSFWHLMQEYADWYVWLGT